MYRIDCQGNSSRNSRKWYMYLQEQVLQIFIPCLVHPLVKGDSNLMWNSVWWVVWPLKHVANGWLANNLLTCNISIITLRPRQNGLYFPDNIIFLYDNWCISIQIYLKSNKNKPALVQNISMAPNRRQAYIWTNGVQDYWRIYASLHKGTKRK